MLALFVLPGIFTAPGAWPALQPLRAGLAGRAHVLVRWAPARVVIGALLFHDESRFMTRVVESVSPTPRSSFVLVRVPPLLSSLARSSAACRAPLVTTPPFRARSL